MIVIDGTREENLHYKWRPDLKPIARVGGWGGEVQGDNTGRVHNAGEAGGDGRGGPG